VQPVAIGFQYVEGVRSNLRLFLGRKRAFVIAIDHPSGLDRPLEQAHVARDMHERHQQRRHVGVLQRLRDKGVVFGNLLFSRLQADRHFFYPGG
jgi:hypothetical protein